MHAHSPTESALALLPPSIAIRRSLRRYGGQSLGIQAFVLARHLLAPLSRVLAAVPTRGRLLDVGCGHGLFANAAALGSPERQVLGVDPSGAKITVARASSAGLPNVRYVQGTVQEIEERDFDAITILDVLYLLPDEAKLAVLRRCHELLAPGGTLLVKTNDTHPRWQYAVVRLEEELMVKLLAFTHGSELHFRGVPEYVALLEQAGFTGRVLDLPTHRPVPHRLYVCRKISP
jgi:2-polyprenyl-3-methyl-5-hydroxy-6-metoxy-1,4-benzoquinol methylase